MRENGAKGNAFNVIKINDYTNQMKGKLGDTVVWYKILWQLARIMGYPDIWFNIILGVPVRVLLCRINIWINRLNKADYPPQCRWSQSCLVVSNSLQPHELYVQSVEFSRPAHWMGSLSLLQGIFPTQGSNPGLLILQADSLPAEPQGEPKNTGVGSLSLLQCIILTQESNRGLLHCRQILYQLSYQGSP